ncbi:hypothetical protein AMTRI_Chr11g158660 [Amborella trichopoda]|uniref:Myb/SANT-like domain-containing protein n=1 Tax=Amborella trichopoda TaxID=13333 RepID=W1NYK0_AMBTC|nr:uncharacterized protein At2g29880 [Amborella trichopoda]ERM99759.1 hypothetical protein AMTR_s00099p00128470 [Amborella trichopoda]|eukprot:XP_006836906.1 uncharacterized protein At2g29880 [Amborella trichopoda]
MSSSTPGTQDRNKATWPPWHDEFLVQQLVEQQNAGRKCDTRWNKEAWKIMIVKFNRQFKTTFTIDQLKSRKKQLYKQYKTIKKLLGQSGFQWDDQMHMVTAAEDVWNGYLLAHHEEKQYRYKCFPLYEQFAVIFEDMSAEGKAEQSTTQLDEKEQSKRDLEAPDAQTELHVSLALDNDGPEVNEVEGEASQSNTQWPITPVTARHPKKRSRMGAGHRTTNALANIEVQNTNHIQGKMIGCGNEGLFSYRSCLNELQGLQGFSETEVVQLVEILKDAYNRDAFMTLKGSVRVAWLRSKIGE